MRKAVNEVFLHVRNGHSITMGRKLVAKEIGRNPNTLWIWQDKLNMKTPVVTKVEKNRNKIAKVNNNNLAIGYKNTVDPAITRTRDQLNTVLTSLVTKNGEFSTKEASAISQVSSNILGFHRHELEIVKFLNKNKKRNILL
jgi:hypothetical protein